jgi:hypothetical protein
VHEPEKAIAIQLRDEHSDKLVVEVDEPEAEIERIRQAAAASVPLGVCQLELGMHCSGRRSLSRTMKASDGDV